LSPIWGRSTSGGIEVPTVTLFGVGLHERLPPLGDLNGCLLLDRERVVEGRIEIDQPLCVADPRRRDARRQNAEEKSFHDAL
jgi:hypothetical protein